MAHVTKPDNARRRKLVLQCIAATLGPLAARHSLAQPLGSSGLVSWPVKTARTTGIHELAPAA